MARGLRKIEQREEQDRLGVVYSSPRLAVLLACVMRIVDERRERDLFLLVSCTAFLCFIAARNGVSCIVTGYLLAPAYLDNLEC